jgi:hypothetical protein
VHEITNAGSTYKVSNLEHLPILHQKFAYLTQIVQRLLCSVILGMFSNTPVIIFEQFCILHNILYYSNETMKIFDINMKLGISTVTFS